ncbi:phosphohydrolase [candidate division KSB3 bacterium]|uniref:Phosphohydrolase n=1 Tax=candidate division KSB3 bacterium TaxID=2044937 RepID=A0A2G6KC73_9BACT|nr:MAG: phosphohydrolase [candidate division KSB3 bacterium]
MSRLLKAISFAAYKHRDQRRKCEMAVPYINHLLAVAETLWERGKVRDIDTVLAGLLHDTLEDTTTSPQELEDLFGEKVRSIVEEVTDDKRLPKSERKRLQIERAGKASLAARHVKLADKICNLRDLIQAPPVGWSRQRLQDYTDWAKQVIDGLRGSNEELEHCFDELCRKATAHFKQTGKEETERRKPYEDVVQSP